MKHYEELHAMQYAENATKVYQYEKFKRMYPILFSRAVFVTRPADSDRDYYVPPALLNCVVVEKCAWDYLGCQYVSCFPFKSYTEKCRGEDPMQWTRVDNELYVPACQPACDRGLTMETVYRDGDCFVTNQAKKLYAMHPERYNGMIAKHARLQYDSVRDRLVINRIYCRAYGLKFDESNEDCYLPTVQYMAEILLGTTVYRRQLLRPLRPDFEPPPPPSSKLLRETFLEEAWTRVPLPVSRPVVSSTFRPEATLNTNLDEHGKLKPQSVSEIVAEVAADVGADLGMQVAVNYASYRLNQKISARLARRILVEKGMKRAFVHGLAKAAASGIVGKSAVLSIGLRAGLSAANVAFAVYGIVAMLIDVFDPYEYGKVLNREQVQRLDRLLDLRYFETHDFRNVRLTPEDVWNSLQDEEDLEDEMSYYAERFEEYLDALKSVSPEQSRQFVTKRDFLKPVTTVSTHPRGGLWVLGLLLVSSLILIRYMEYVGFLLFAILAFYCWIR